jgi:hypothetical protein
MGRIILLAMEEILGRRPLSQVEQIFLCEKFLNIASVQETLPLLKRLGLKPHEHILTEMRKLRLLHPSLLLALHKGSISTRNASELLPLNHEDQEIIAHFITALKLGGSKQRKLIGFCKDLLMKEDIALDQILRQCPYSPLEEHDENIPQQVAKMFAWFEEMCSPRSHQKVDNFKRKVASLHLPGNMTVSHTQSFEDDAVTLSVRFDNWQSFQTSFQKIRQLLEQNEE